MHLICIFFLKFKIWPHGDLPRGQIWPEKRTDVMQMLRMLVFILNPWNSVVYHALKQIKSYDDLRCNLSSEDEITVIIGLVACMLHYPFRVSRKKKLFFAEFFNDDNAKFINYFRRFGSYKIKCLVCFYLNRTLLSDQNIFLFYPK